MIRTLQKFVVKKLLNIKSEVKEVHIIMKRDRLDDEFY